MTRSKWVIMIVAVSLMGLATAAVPSTENTEGEAEAIAALNTEGDSLVAKLRTALRASKYELGSYRIPGELGRAVSSLFYAEFPAPQAALRLIANVKAELEDPEAMSGGDYNWIAARVLWEVFAIHLRDSRECGGAVEWCALGDAALSHMRAFVTNTRLPMEIRVEAARQLAVNEVRGGATDFIKLFCMQNPPEEDNLLASDGHDWRTWSEVMQVMFVNGFLSGEQARCRIAGSVSHFSHRVGVYNLEMEVFYEKVENRDVSVIEAMFRVQDILSAR